MKRLAWILLLIALCSAAALVAVRSAGGFTARRTASSFETWIARAARSITTPSETKQRKNPVPLTSEALAAGLAHWADHCADLAYRRLPAFASARVVGGWSGFYMMSPDAHGLIGALPEPRGFYCATGFSGHGFQHSPATGLLLSEIILHGKSTTLDIHALRPTRFVEGEPIVEKYVV